MIYKRLGTVNLSLSAASFLRLVIHSLNVTTHFSAITNGDVARSLDWCKLPLAIMVAHGIIEVSALFCSGWGLWKNYYWGRPFSVATCGFVLGYAGAGASIFLLSASKNYGDWNGFQQVLRDDGIRALSASDFEPSIIGDVLQILWSMFFTSLLYLRGGMRPLGKLKTSNCAVTLGIVSAMCLALGITLRVFLRYLYLPCYSIR